MTKQNDLDQNRQFQQRIRSAIQRRLTSAIPLCQGQVRMTPAESAWHFIEDATEGGLIPFSKSQSACLFTTCEAIPVAQKYGQRFMMDVWHEWLNNYLTEHNDLVSNFENLALLEQVGLIEVSLITQIPLFESSKDQKQYLQNILIEIQKVSSDLCNPKFCFSTLLRSLLRSILYLNNVETIACLKSTLMILWKKIPDSEIGISKNIKEVILQSMMILDKKIACIWIAEKGFCELWSQNEIGPVKTSTLIRRADLMLDYGYWTLAKHMTEAVIKRQRANGSLRTTSQFGMGDETTSSLLQYLNLLLKYVSSSMERSKGQLPTEVSLQDARMKTVTNWLEMSQSEKLEIADIGCGSGRFLKKYVQRNPHHRYTATGRVASSLGKLPGDVQQVSGNLLALPFAENSFDRVISIEAVEHTLVPQRAVEELIRIVKPGGELLLIDKNQKRQMVSDLQPWERWFTPNEVTDWLFPDCETVDVEPIPQEQSAVNRDPLYLCWKAVKAGSK